MGASVGIQPEVIANVIRGSVMIVAGVITNSEDAILLGRRLAGGSEASSSGMRQPSPEELQHMYEQLEKWKRELGRLKSEPPNPDALVQREEELKEIEEKHRLLEEELTNYPRPEFLGEPGLPGVVNVAVVGNSGVGKSLLINSLRDVNSGDETWAPVGVQQTTVDPVCYMMPGVPGMKLWDLAGAGSQLFPRGGYTRAIGLRHFDVVLVVTTCRFTQTEAALLSELAGGSAPSFVVRTMVDVDIASNLADHGQTEGETKLGILEDLRVRGVPAPYLVNARAPGAHDFPRLKEDILRAGRGEARQIVRREPKKEPPSAPKTPLKFEVGETAEVWSKDLKLWVKCVIDKKFENDEYAISIPGAPEAIKDVPKVPAPFLRKAQAFKTGEEAEIIVLQGPTAGSWAKCCIMGEGDKPDTYNVAIPGAPPGKRQVSGVHNSALRKVAKAQAPQLLLKPEDLTDMLTAFKEVCSTKEFQATVDSLQEMGMQREDVKRMKKIFVSQQLSPVLIKHNLASTDVGWGSFLAFTREQGKDPEIAKIAHEVERLMRVRVGDFFHIAAVPGEGSGLSLRQRLMALLGNMLAQYAARTRQQAQAQAGMGAPTSRQQRATAGHVDPMSRSAMSMISGSRFLR